MTDLLIITTQKNKIYIKILLKNIRIKYEN
jgi:hypothetical protein